MAQYPAGPHHIRYGTTVIEFSLIYCDRKTLAVHVHPDRSVTVEAPLDSDFERVESKVRKRARWILKQQQAFETYQSPQLIRQYVSGETYRYLGRQYRLKVRQSDIERVQFSRGIISLQVKDTGDYHRKKQLLEAWYRARAKFIFRERLDVCYPKLECFGIPYPTLSIRRMKSQWGSCSPSGKLTLNLKLIQAPKKLIDYAVLHELCHLKALNHSDEFYALLGRVLPNWHELRDELNRLELSEI